MDIFNRPPPISEDTLQYEIYPDISTSSSKESVAALSTLINSHINTLLPNAHIWHRDAFELKLAPSSFKDDEWILEGRMRVGDCVDDEWCVVWLLREVSKLWDVAVSVYDSDGEFLLIEAAEALPSWVTPSNSENRVWMYKSNLHLIPLPHVSAPSHNRTRKRRHLAGANDSDDDEANDDEEYLSLPDALNLLRTPEVDTKASYDIQNAAFRRIQSYPSALSQHTHLTKAYLPTQIIQALSQNPSLVQKAVEAFYTRDALQFRAAQKMTSFPPTPSHLAQIRMTRPAYAQLLGQKFHPPKVFGAWMSGAREGSKEWRWRDLGMKTACGFEMLYSESKGKAQLSQSLSSYPTSTEAVKDALQRDTSYTSYIQSLINAGYFPPDAIKGSKKWNEMEEKAVRYWVELKKDDDANRPSFAALVNNAVASATSSNFSVPSNVEDATEDSDNWLSVDPSSLDGLLASASGMNKATAQATDKMDIDEDEDAKVNEQAKRMKDLAGKVEKFVEGEGDLEGAVFDDEVLSSEGEFSNDSDSNSDQDSDTQPAHPPQESSEDLKRRAEALLKLVPPLPSSEYGQMPSSYHSNSQRTKPTTLESETTAPVPGAPPKPVRKPILMRDKFDGVDSDDETDSEDGVNGDEEDEEDKPTIAGDGEVEVDMEEEEEEFLKFSRDALGISEEMWGNIVKERQDRGAFVPSSSNRAPPPTEDDIAATMPKLKGAFSAKSSATAPAPPQATSPKGRPNANPNLNSFEAVMQAMDDELQKNRNAQQKKGKTKAPPPTAKDKGKGKAKEQEPLNPEDEEDIDVDEAMAEELRYILKKDDSDYGEEEGENETPMDYNMIKNFLESFKSQGGLSGPVSNLAGRLEGGWTFPRDEGV